MLVALRFGDWDILEELDVAPPGNYSRMWPYGHGVTRHFSLTVASLHFGDFLAAGEHLKAMKELMPAVVATGDEKAMNFTHIAINTALAVQARSRGDLEGSIEFMRRAVEQELSLPY